MSGPTYFPAYPRCRPLLKLNAWQHHTGRVSQLLYAVFIPDDRNFHSTEKIATISVGRKELTVTASDHVRMYGQANPQFTLSYEGFVSGDNASDIMAPVASTSATITSFPGVYPITLSGGSSSNYTFVFVEGSLTLEKATQVIVFDAIPDKVSGDKPFDLVATASSGLPVEFEIASGPAMTSGKVLFKRKKVNYEMRRPVVKPITLLT